MNDGSLLGRIRLMRVVSHMFNGFKMHISVGVGGHGVLANVTRVVKRTSGVMSVAMTVSGLSGVKLRGMGTRLTSGKVPRRTVSGLRPVVLLDKDGRRGLRALGAILTADRTKLGKIRRDRFVLGAISTLNIGDRIRLSLALTHNLGCCAKTVFRIGTLSIRVNDVDNNNHCSGLANIFNVSNVSNMNVSFKTSHVFSILGRLSLCPGRTIGKARLLFMGFNSGRTTCYLPVLAGIHRTKIHTRVCPSTSGVGGRVKCTGSGRVPFITVINRGRVGRKGLALGGVAANRRSLIAPSRLLTIIGT